MLFTPSPSSVTYFMDGPKTDALTKLFVFADPVAAGFWHPFFTFAVCGLAEVYYFMLIQFVKSPANHCNKPRERCTAISAVPGCHFVNKWVATYIAREASEKTSSDWLTRRFISL